MTQYDIYEGNMEQLRIKLTRIKNKCEKYNCTFAYKEIGETFKDIVCEDGIKRTLRFITVEVEGTAKVNGWKFVASLDYTPKGNIINKCCEAEIPEKYYFIKPYCEHCGNRNILHAFIVLNEETGEFKLVGRSCLRDFTGGMSAESVAQYTSLFSCLIEGSTPSGDSFVFHEEFDTDKLLTLTAEIIRVFGYTPVNGRGDATVDLVRAFWRLTNDRRLSCEESSEHYKELFNKCDWSNTERHKETVENLVEWVLSQEAATNYMHNLQVACSLKYVTYKQIGLLVSAFPAYNREHAYLARQRKEAKKFSMSEHVGSIGARISLIIVEHSCITSWETQWGPTFVYKFVGADGNVYTWKTSKFLGDNLAGYSLTGTVKEHTEFRGVKQTDLTRCKLERSVA